VNAVSGTVLFVTDATSKLANPAFYIKMSLVFLAVGVMVVMRRRVFRDPGLDAKPIAVVGKRLAIASIVCWFGAIAAGRFMTYVGGG
jgi:hypothetical protein